MARYIQHIYLNKPDDFVYFIINDYLQKNQFIMSDWKGEPAYQSGNVLTDGLRYLKWSYTDGFLHLEAWIKGNFGEEWDLNGFVGCLMKKPYRESLEELLRILQQEIPNLQSSYGTQGFPGTAGQEGPVYRPGMQGGPQNTFSEGGMSFHQGEKQVIPVQTVDNHKAATNALIMGILSLVFCWIPIAAIVLGCLGLSRARLGAGSSKSSSAAAGRICSIIGICLGCLLWILNFLITIVNMA